MSISNYLNKIKNAVFGKDVRGAIHDAIKQCYDDASINHDNANMEVKLARGTHDTLNDRLDKSDQNLAQTNAQLSQITLLAPASNDIAVLQNFIDTLPYNCEVKFPRYDYFLEDVLVFKEKKDIKINLIDAKFIQQKHGYGCLEINNCKNVQVVGGHLIGYGNFPPQTFAGSILHNEKTDAVSWGSYRNGENITTPYGGGYLYNCGIGLLIYNGCDRILVQRVEVEGFNYSGISVGFSDNSNVNKNITLYKCYTHDNFDNGINVQRVEFVEVDGCKSSNNGHPSALLTDAQINPGYGFTSRLALTENAVAKGVIVKNSTFNNNKRKGIDAHSGLNIVFENNQVYASYHSGIAIVNTSGGLFDTYSIKNNKISSCGNNDLQGGDTSGGIIVFCDGDGEVVNNKLYNCADRLSSRGSWNIGLTVQGGTVVIESNRLYDSGLVSAVVVKNHYCWVNKNYIKYIGRDLREDYVFRILSDKGEINYNYIECGGNGMFFSNITGEFMGNEIIVTGKDLLCGSDVNIVNRTKYDFIDSVNVNRNMGTNDLKTLVCRVTIADGVAKFVDFSNFVSNIESHPVGFKINFKRDIKPIGSYFTKMTSLSSLNASNLWQYGLTASDLILGVDDELSGYGKELECLKDMILLVYVVVR